MLNTLYFKQAFAQAPAVSESALSYKFTITDQKWLLEHEQQAVEIMQTPDNEMPLLAYQHLIYAANDLWRSVALEASLIGLFVVALILFSIIKPRLILHPVMLILFLPCILFALHIYQQLALLRIHAENLRYYFLLLTA